MDAEVPHATETGERAVAVVGATGAVGRPMSRLLTAAGHAVRPITGSAGVRLDDEEMLRRSMAGADAAFVMVPFDRSSANLHAYEEGVVMRLADAVERAALRRVIVLSGTSASLGLENAGSGAGAAMLEQQFLDLGVPEIVVVRAAYHMENLLSGFDEIEEDGIFHGPFNANRATPMVAAIDVGTVAAGLLTADSLEGPVIRELLGAGEYTMDDAAAAIGSALGRAGRYVQIGYDDARAAMITNDTSRSFVEAVMDTARSFNAGLSWEREPRSSENTTSTTLEAFCEAVARQRGGQ